MRTEKFSGVMESAYGKPLASPIKFDGEYEAYGTDSKKVEQYTESDWSEAYAEIPEKEKPVIKDLVNLVNNARKAAARQQSMNEALRVAGIEKPTLETDPQLQLRTIYKALKASGKTEEQARQIASTTLGVEWID